MRRSAGEARERVAVGRDEVHLQDLVPVGVRGLGQRRFVQDARVQDERVEPAEDRDRVVDRARDRSGVAGVRDDERGAGVGGDRVAARPSRPVKTTFAPSLASRPTIAAPMPDVPPVTRVRTSSRRPIAGRLSQLESPL